MTGWAEKTAAGISYLERDGEGVPLVLLHGIGSEAASFSPLLDHIDAARRVIAWNAPGYGASEPLGTEWPLAQDYARVLGQFMEALGLNRVVLLGHSLGALMAAAFAAAHREHVQRLILASPALGHGMPRGGVLSPAAKSRITDLEELGSEAFAAARASRLVHAPNENPGIVATVQAAMSRISLPGYAQAARMLASGRLLDDAERLNVPTDVIVGAEDQITPPDGARRAYRALRQSIRGQLSIIPDAGHAIYLQAPAAVCAALSAEPHTVA